MLVMYALVGNTSPQRLVTEHIVEKASSFHGRTPGFKL